MNGDKAAAGEGRRACPFEDALDMLAHEVGVLQWESENAGVVGGGVRRRMGKRGGEGERMMLGSRDYDEREWKKCRFWWTLRKIFLLHDTDGPYHIFRGDDCRVLKPGERLVRPSDNYTKEEWGRCKGVWREEDEAFEKGERVNREGEREVEEMGREAEEQGGGERKMMVQAKEEGDEGVVNRAWRGRGSWRRG